MNNRDALFNLPLVPPAPKDNGVINKAQLELTHEVERVVEEFDVYKGRKQLMSDSEELWRKRGEDRALKLFHAAAEHVPAYKDFLKKEKIQHEKIKTIEDFQQVPLIDKENYLRVYPTEALCWYGNLPAAHMISVSSGSSGTPFFWPRGQILEGETALEHEIFLTSSFDLDKYSTLFLVCFAMGMYVAGPITMNSLLRLNSKGYPVSVATPGYSPDDVLRIIPEMAPKYDQIVLAGYPPYIKEIMDQGIQRGIDWSQIKVKFLLAGEGFNESWRTYVAELAGYKSPVKDFINLYGTADAAVLGYETQASIIIRRRIAQDTRAREVLFNSERLPSFLQYHPEHKFFELVNEELVFTATGGVPLVRYNIHDSGGILTRAEILLAVPQLKEYFYELEAEHNLFNLPFVYVFGKSDQTVILYGANVYPENIKIALENEDIRQDVTGKFVMHVELDEEQNQCLHIEVECADRTDITKELIEKVSNTVYKTLLEVNSEYRSSHRGSKEHTMPLIKMHSHGHEYFHKKTVKHKWKHSS